MKQKPLFQIFGIFGCPLAHTLSPAMQEAAFRRAGIRAYYLVFELHKASFRTVMKQLGLTGLAGFNVTVPYKETVIRYLDRISTEARRIGAVNTVYRRGTRWCGTNTDVYGFMHALTREGGFKPRGKRALILGAGGASRAVVYGLADAGIAHIALTDIALNRARQLVRYYRPMFPKTGFETCPIPAAGMKFPVSGYDLVVNATPVGLHPGDPVLIPLSEIPLARPGKKMLFYDLIYYPSETPFLKLARSRGHKGINGLGMLIHQGARAFECWTGKPAGVQGMKEALLQALRQREANLK